MRNFLDVIEDLLDAKHLLLFFPVWRKAVSECLERNFLRQSPDNRHVDDFRRKLSKLKRVGNNGPLLAYMFCQSILRFPDYYLDFHLLCPLSMLPGKSSILCFYSKCKCLKISEINPYLLPIFQRNSLAINKIHDIVCIVNGSDDDTARKTKKPTTEAKMILTMKAEREGYAPDQIARTMTVGELIEFLNNFDEDEKIYLSHDNGYTYGGITAYRFEEIDEEAEKE